MKHPFESIEDMQFLGGEKVRWRPWMINVGCVRFLRETDDEDVELVELLVSFSQWNFFYVIFRNLKKLLYLKVQKEY